MSAISISEQQLGELIGSGELLLIDLWAPWCGDCRRIGEAYEQIAEEYADTMRVYKLNVDGIDGIWQRLEIQHIPTLRLYQGGQLLGQIWEPPAKADIYDFLNRFLPAKQKKDDEQVHDIAILGGGPAGYTAALYASRAGMDTVLLEQMSAGGQMTLTTRIDNYPGFPKSISGTELGELMRSQAERFGARTRSAQVRSVSLQADPKVITTSEGTVYARAVVIATGASPRELGVPEESELIGRGVAYCAACDGHLYKGKTVAVVGGGNSAAADILLLSRIAEKVIVIHRRDTLRATKIYHEPLLQARNVTFCWNTTVTRFLHDDVLTGLVIRNVQTGEEQEIACDGVFISIGRKPATELVEGQLALENGYVLADESTRTSIPGVFAAGDVRTKPLRQIVTAVADGAAAVHMAEEYLSRL